MAKQKKKVNAFQNDKLAKIHYKKSYLKRFKVIINAIAGEDIYSQIPDIVLENLFRSRVHSLKIVASEGQHIPKKLLIDSKAILSGWAKLEKINITPCNIELSFDEYKEVG
jgi:hypothetical protein